MYPKTIGKVQCTDCTVTPGAAGTAAGEAAGGGAGGEVGGDRAGDGSPGGCARAWGWLRECGGVLCVCV